MVIRIPDTFTVEQSEKYLASIRLEPGGLSFFCCHAATGEDFFSAKVQFEQPQTYVSALKECFFDNECLSWKYKQLCLLATETPYTLVPETYYEKERRDALFAFNFPEASATRQILENKLADGTVLLYALPEEVYSFCARSFAAPEFLHSAALLLEQWKRLSETSLYKQLFVQVCGQHIELACFAPQGKLRLANSFEVRSTRDILYYILYVWKQEGLDQLNDRLFLSGSPARCAELRQALSLYLRHVSPVPLPAEAYLRQEEWADAPLDIIYLFS